MAEGFVRPPAAASGCRLSLPAVGCGVVTLSLPTTKNPGSPIYASRIRVPSGGSNRVQALPVGNADL